MTHDFANLSKLIDRHGDKPDKRGSLRPIMKRILWVARPSGIPAASTGAGRPRYP
jgi:hypothetical protein